MICKPINIRLWLILAFAIVIASISSSKSAAPEKTYASFKVEIKGKGQPLLLIPGLSCSGDVWKETVARYSKHYQCHIFTLAGYAGVPAIQAPLLETASRDIRQYVKDQKLQKPLVMGHSIGGYLTIKMASEEPTLFGKVIVVDALPFLPAAGNRSATEEAMRATNLEANVKQVEALPAAQFAQLQRRTIETMISDPKQVEQALQWSLSSDRATLIRSAAEMMQNDLRDEIASVTAPTLVLGSYFLAEDQRAQHPQFPKAGLEVYQQQYQKLKGAKVEITNTARHFIMYDDPEWFFAQVDSFLK